MPLTRYQIRNEYSLADPELYRAADKDDPEALLEGVAMAGLVGLLRQLGDLAEFAAEIFHDLHEEVMATSARGHGLTLRVQQLEADFPEMENAFLSQINHSIFLHNSGVDWHPNLRLDESLVTQGDLPRFVMDSYEECRGPPRLFLLDKFDIAGAGACLKRYTDPSFFKSEFTASEVAKEKLKRENKAFKVKKKPSRWRNGDNPEAIASHSNRRLHELLLEERCQSENNVHTHHVKLKRRHSTNSLVDSTSGKSYMERFINKHSPDSKFVCESSAISSRSKTGSIDISGMMSERDIHETSPSVTRERSLVPSHSKDHAVPRASLDEFDVDVIEERNPKKLFESGPAIELENIPSSFFKVENKEEIVVHTADNAEATVVDGYHSDVNSEMENYIDALTTMDSEIETDTESKPKNERGFKVGRKSGEFETNEEQEDIQAPFSDFQSIGNSVVSEDGNDSLQNGRLSSSYPDIFCNAVENILSDGDLAQPSPKNVDISTKTSDIKNASSGSSNEISENDGQLSLNSENDGSAGHESSRVTYVSDTPSHSRDNSLSVRSHKGDARRMLDKVNLGTSYENSFHLSNGVGSVEEGKYVDIDEKLPIGAAVDKHNANQVNGKLDSPDSVLVNSETELNDLVQEHIDARLGTRWIPQCRPDSLSDGTAVDLKEMMPSGEKEEYLTSMVDCSEIDDFREQKDLKLIGQAPSLELDKAEVGIVDSAVEAERNNLESSGPNYFGVMEASRSGDISHELPFTCTISDATKSVSAAEAPLEVVCAETKSLCSEDVEDTVMHNSHIGSNDSDVTQDKLKTIALTIAISLPDNNALQDSVEEKPPLPPLPPMQWRAGKRSPTSGGDTALPSLSKFSLLSEDITNCMAQESYPTSRDSFVQPLNPFLPHPTSDTENPQHDFQMLGSEVVQPSLIPSSLLVPAVEYLNVRRDPSLDSTITKPLNPLLPLIDEDLQHGSSNTEEEVLQHISLDQFTPGSPTEDLNTRYVSSTSQEELKQPAVSLAPLKCGEYDKLLPQISTTPPTMENEKDGHESQTLEGELKWQVNSSAVVPTIDYGNPNGSIKSRPPRPRDPLIEAVASHDKSNLRKVTERIIPQIQPQVDERNSLLEQIRRKSFNLKPAVATRPSIHGPKTNLKVVAILEKANAIRQALAGSDDEDDDEDSWSDS